MLFSGQNNGLVDSITWLIYFIKLFEVHRNIFTCRIIKLKTDACENAGRDQGKSAYPGHWQCFKKTEF
ncbi:hypothetical protein A4D02_13645 [Niastella koreensis]|uniref:Uncharacterized protein n=1 Tax=Niastella koreensis TaxID=354356 RepID=A0ABX3NQ59_9BACT|nr:hypothetical protein A4D02_13645 [Niastella koreensis]